MNFMTINYELDALKLQKYVKSSNNRPRSGSNSRFMLYRLKYWK